MYHLLRETAVILLFPVFKKREAFPYSRVSRTKAVKEPCTVLEELHETKTKALKTVNICYYCLQDKYSTYCLFFTQLILSTVLLERYYCHCFVEEKN